MHFRESRSWLLASLFLLVGAASAGAGTLSVAVTGTDADGCGTKTAPCRSISRAITNAISGDKIVVGPGRYGDLDADGVLGEPGEEGDAAGGMVLVDKALTIESVEGAATTVIDANGANLNAVTIAADGVKLGKAKKGFTVTGSARIGVAVGFATDVTVSGIRAVRNGTGFGSKSSGLAFRANVAEANEADGFVFTGGGCSFTACRATANGANGFALSGDGGGHVVKSCVASANGEDGFQIFADGSSVNKSVGNGNDVGLRIGGASIPGQLGTNAFLGNHTAGVIVTAPNVTITKTNVFGNGSNGTNCGVTVAGAGTVTLDKVCFGAPTGPGDDPADLTCGGAGGIEILEILKKALAVSPKVPL